MSPTRRHRPGQVTIPATIYSELSPLHRIWREYIAKGCKGTLIYAPTDVSYGIARMVHAVIDANEFEGEGSFLPVRTREELQEGISRLEKQG